MNSLALAGSIASEFQIVAGELQQPAEILQRFEKEFAATACNIEELAKPDSVTTPADYKAFEWFPGLGKPTFINKIRSVMSRSEAEKQVSRWHEGIHAIHASTVPVTHFTPYNMGNMNIILSPHSYIKLTLLTERAAAAGVSMLSYLDGRPEIRQAAAREAATVEDFERAMNANAQNKEVALNRVARECLLKNSNEYMIGWGNQGKRPANEALWLYNYYIWQALREYHESNRFKFADELYDSPRPIFIALADEDVAAIGNVVGFNAFGSKDNPDSFFTCNPSLMSKHWSWLAGLNTMLQIPEDRFLPTLKEALDDCYGITPEDAMNASKQYKHGDKVLAPRDAANTKVIPFVPGVINPPA